MGPSLSPVWGRGYLQVPPLTLAATAARSSFAGALFAGSVLPVTIIVVMIIAIWYLAAIPMNTVLSQPLIDQAGGGLVNTLSISWSLPRPVLPAPHQVIAELWATVFTVAPWQPRSLLYHCWVTLSSTLLGFALGTLLGIALAIAIVHVKALNRSLMPWIIASQTIPILAIAPMIIVVLG